VPHKTTMSGPSRLSAARGGAGAQWADAPRRRRHYSYRWVWSADVPNNPYFTGTY